MEKATTCDALSVNGVIGTFFFKNDAGHVTTINKDRYLTLLKKPFVPTL